MNDATCEMPAANATTKATLRGRTISIQRDGRRFFVWLLPNCDVEIRERFARHGVTITANELLTKHDQLKGGVLFPEALQ